MNYGKVIGKAVAGKWHTHGEKEWWYTKFSNARRRKTVRLSEAQNHRCAFCGCHTWLADFDKGSKNKNTLATLEHIIPQSGGGTDHYNNLVMACQQCNSIRGSIDAYIFYELRQNKKWRHAVMCHKRMLQGLDPNVTEKQISQEKIDNSQHRRGELVWRLVIALTYIPNFKEQLEAAVDYRLNMNKELKEAKAKKSRELREKAKKLAALARAAEDARIIANRARAKTDPDILENRRLKKRARRARYRANVAARMQEPSS